MDTIEKLKYHEKDNLDEWLDYDEKKSRKFLKEVVKFAKENNVQIKNYCINTIPSEFSSLSIIYEALSEYSIDFNEFLFTEIQRVVNLTKSKKVNAEYLEVLTDIETEDIYSKTVNIYIKIMGFLTHNLHVNNDDKFNIQMLDIIDWYLIDLDEDDDITESKEWINQIKKLADEANLNVKLKAREVLKNSEVSVSLKPLSTLEKIKSFFK